MDEKEVLPYLAAAIRSRRKKAGLTMSQLAELAGIDAGFLAYIETVKKMPSLITVTRIAKALNVSLSEFFRAAPTKEIDLEYELQQQIRSLFRDRTRDQKADLLVILK